MAKKMIINWTTATEQVGGDRAFLQEVIDDLLTEARAAQSEISTAIEAKDFEGVRHAAHRIKGSASYLSCDELQDISLQLQDVSRAGMNGDNDASILWQDVRLKFDKFCSALQSLEKEVTTRK
jgi:HPt (histidine-containing phosphotransfer) domain-containing protein